ncbi:hypothetical protein MKW94_020948 [Papaver nudicaule]|uniref:Uncharacterized protein n=1 Tax=Papaver nudicaule TaxID=74823 RepID=A0AA41RNJ6_PAPNU|nr:hypothetical protein [Papaver nudicaule]
MAESRCTIIVFVIVCTLFASNALMCDAACNNLCFYIVGLNAIPSRIGRLFARTVDGRLGTCGIDSNGGQSVCACCGYGI